MLVCEDEPEEWCDLGVDSGRGVAAASCGLINLRPEPLLCLPYYVIIVSGGSNNWLAPHLQAGKY